MVRPLSIAEVSGIHFQGGSILRTSRANPTRTSDDLRRTVQALRELHITSLLIIDGDDTAFAAFELEPTLLILGLQSSPAGSH